MSDTITIARPYAKAIFEHAQDVNKLSEWSEILLTLSIVASMEQVKRFVSNPAVTSEQQIELMSAPLEKITGSEAEHVINLLSILAYNKRLEVLPEICQLFEALRAEAEKTLTVKVSSHSILTAAQQQHLVTTLAQRLKRQVTLDITIDESLLGGAIIQAGDLVIDGSVRGKLNKLGAALAA